MRQPPRQTYLVESAASLLPEPLVLIEQRDDLANVDTLREAVHKVLTHMQPNVTAYQIIQPEQGKKQRMTCKWKSEGSRGGGQERTFRTPSSLFDQNLAHVAGEGCSIYGGGGGGGGRGREGGGGRVSEVNFSFLEQHSFSYLALIVTAMALHTM